MKKILLLFLITSVAIAQNSNRKFEQYKKTGNGIEISTSDGKYILKPYSDNIIETSFIPNGEVFNPESHAVILVPKKVKTKITDTKSTLTFATGGLTAIIQKSPFKISYLYKNKALISEKNGYTKKDSTKTIDFNLDNIETLYGGGARALGMNRRGNRLQLYNRAHYGYETRAELMNFTMPLVMSSKIYAVHFDNEPIGYLDLDSKKDNTLAYETISGRMTYQVIADDSWAGLMNDYTDLTGKQPLLPRWALGNFSSRFGYHSQEETQKTIDRFISDGIPVDAIILDLYWFGKTIQGTMGNLDWDKDKFPNPTKMISDLNDKGVKTILITEPFILTTSSKWQEAVDKKILATDKTGKPCTYDFYFGNTGIIDVFKPEGKAWFWDIYKKMIDQGVGGLWGDLGEPEVFPSKAITAKGKADEVHNVYGHNWAKLVFDGYQKDFPNQRPFILMRSGYSGSQRFGMVPWSGDVNRSWGGLQSQSEIALQMGMQGMGYMHSDLGGFAGDYFDNELYLRWLQYGVFQPILRPHAQEEVASEPVYKDIVTKAKAKKLVEMRYQLMPYNYTLAFQNNQKGMPLMRPLFFEEPQNNALTNVADSYLWGNDFLVMPITKSAVTSAAVYFPKNNSWFDLFTDQLYVGGSSKMVPVKEDNIPVFVRGGAFIPMIKTIQNTTKYSLANFDLHYYFDGQTPSSSGELYDDDGNTANAFEKGQYEMMRFKANMAGKTLTINLTAETGKAFTATDKQVTLMLHHIDSKIQKLTVNGKEIAFMKANNVYRIPVSWLKGTTATIQIQF